MVFHRRDDVLLKVCTDAQRKYRGGRRGGPARQGMFTDEEGEEGRKTRRGGIRREGEQHAEEQPRPMRSNTDEVFFARWHMVWFVIGEICNSPSAIEQEDWQRASEP